MSRKGGGRKKKLNKIREKEKKEKKINEEKKLFPVVFVLRQEQH